MSLHENGLTPTVKKEKILVGILVVPPFITETKMEGTDGESKIIYGGFVYEMWTLIKELNGWNNYVKEVSVEVDYDKVVMDVYNQKYDMVVGNFWVFRDRVEKVLMSRTLFVTKIVVIFKPKKSRINTILAIGLTYFIVPLVIIILLGIIFGYGLYLIEPRRGALSAARTAIASFFGGKGVANSTTKISALLYIYIMLAFSYFFHMVLQGFVTTDIMGEMSKNELNAKNIGTSQPLVVSNIYDLGEVMEKHGVEYKSIDKSIPDIPKVYLANTDKYSGYLSEYEQAKVDIVAYPELRITKDIFGFKENSIIVTNSRPELKKAIDISIVQMHYNDSIGTICKKYMTKDDALYCSL